MLSVLSRGWLLLFCAALVRCFVTKQIVFVFACLHNIRYNLCLSFPPAPRVPRYKSSCGEKVFQVACKAVVLLEGCCTALPERIWHQRGCGDDFVTYLPFYELS